MNYKFMTKTIFILLTILSSQLFAFDNFPKKELLADIKEQTKKCTVQIVTSLNESEAEIVKGFKSVCKSLVIVSPSEAKILIDGEWLIATISESEESDGGDLDDLTISNLKGEVLATKTNIAAYDSVLVAMAGESNFKKIHTK